jgi:threonine/homoserine/homoserine lactone efflux protein
MDRMELFTVAILGGIWLSLLYSATVVPASVWVIQLTVSRGWLCGLTTSAAMAIGQLPWCLLAGLLLFTFPAIWQAADLWLRLAAAAFAIWMASRSARAPGVLALRLEVTGTGLALFSKSLWRSFSMPWRLPLWAAFIVSVSVHLRGPGWQAAVFFTTGALIGQLLWFAHFVLVAGLFGNRVPVDISLHSMNKFRLLATLVQGGLAVIILSPLALML